MNISQTKLTKGSANEPVIVDLSIDCSLVMEDAPAIKSKKTKNKRYDMTAVLTLTSDLDYVDFRRIPYADYF